MTDPVLELTSVRKSYPGTPVLDGIDLAVEEGQFVSIVGPSGCGKSTLFTLLAGLDTADSGTVVTPRCAYMPQKDLLFPWRSVLANTALGLEVQGVPKAQARSRARDLFPVFGLDGFENARPSSLSGGMRQRAALLRTVVQGRDVLLLDEPFGALDSLTRTAMQDWVQEVWQRYRWTVLMITHDIREAVQVSDRVVVLSPRPARVVADVSIDLPRPRRAETATTREFATYERALLDALGSTGPRPGAGE
ncbi:ABC transporter ATP-binding protein [Rhodococcus sp. BP-349]|uniref:ABC transporter ATP-binding protein n=1 Tax=unclassified Rhodococcus (in: high G+C Gram-positive bacteria) TaxID=192944 RepID=UPI001C9B6B68|nr:MULTISPECIES: ABC transporter ATP-binding protein [unclassified Rhodococcus (in: high G+C Gram-positive bacteria)]MBY6540173.1 ABC transporter ATP-binding protein [Rhodococcus sp. BP-363]MBY6543499.1 ABC transporter ATP-binding protein [Rhodococcus sp. BP-369]MBY6562729.1 ABC transporter ATP-binding protein [Rhodococcus sp. BP-370]MBY6577021.1 ABC transporter ATP-binding protein [Rhodococcus sp. BP-364]MBY6586322.1 ABC transporter ATP-binding protein [Rhodococcus sp. BP-358]